MRDGLTFLAILLIAVLTGALVAPYFIDWTAHRATIESRLSQAAGVPVSVTGQISVRLLPEPVFKLGGVAVGGSPGDGFRFAADEVDVAVSIPALLRGELQVSEARLRAPHLDLAVGGEGLQATRIGSVVPERFGFQHVAIEGGTLSIALPDRAPFSIGGLDLDAEATSLLGPFRATGSFGPAADRRPFRLSTGAVENGKIRAKLVLDGAGGRPSLDLDGGASLDPARGGVAVDATATLAGAVPLSGEAATVPWRLTGRLRGTLPTSVAIDDLDLRAGAGLAALDATGKGELTAEGPPWLRLDLHGAALNLDTLAAAPDGGGVAPSGVDLLGRFAALGAGWPEIGGALPVALALDLKLDTATAGPQTLLDLGARVAVEPGKPIGLSASVKGPDGARLALDGTLETGAAPVFRGRLDAGTRDLPRLAEWLAPEWAGAPDWVRRNLPARSVSFAGTVDLSGVGIAARDASLTLDRMTAAGTVSFTREVDREPARLFADLRSDALDLDALPDVADAGLDWGKVDLDLALAAKAVTVVPTGIGPVDAGRLALRIRKTGDTTTLDELSADIGSARVSGSGRMDARAASLTAKVDAPQLDAVAAALARLVPGRLTTALQARAPTLSPARLDVRIEAQRAADGGLLASALAVDGTAGGSRVKVDLRPDQPGDIDPATAAISATLTADAEDAVALMRQLGLPVATGAQAGLGAARFAGSAHGSVATGFECSADLDLAGTKLGFRGRAGAGLGSGQLHLSAADLSPLLTVAGLARPTTASAWTANARASMSWHDGAFGFHRLAGRLGGIDFGGDIGFDSAPVDATDTPAKAALFGSLSIAALPAARLFDLAFGPVTTQAGSGPWPDAPFGAVVLRLPRTALALKIDALALRDGLVARSAAMTLKAERGAITLADLTAGLGDGRIGATLTLRRDGPAAALNGGVSWSGVTVERPGFKVRVGGALDLAGTGTTPALLVANLGGTGTLQVADAEVARLDPGALARTAALVEKNTDLLDAEAIGQALRAELARGPLPIGKAAASMTLAGGTLVAGPLRAEGGAWSADADARIDLKGLSSTLKVLLRSRPSLPDWHDGPAQASVTLEGSDASAPRTIDASAFVNTLQARAIARDQERIDVIQQDMRERAYFNRRLKAIEADQAAARERARAAAEAARQRPKPDTAPPPGGTSDAGPAREPSGGPSPPIPLRRPSAGRTAPLDLLPPAAVLNSAQDQAPAPAVRAPSSAGR